jgi:hypothetical protein
MKVTRRKRRSIVVFLAGFISFAMFWPAFGVLPSLGIGFAAAAAAMAIDAGIASRRNSRRA